MFTINIAGTRDAIIKQVNADHSTFPAMYPGGQIVAALAPALGIRSVPDKKIPKVIVAGTAKEGELTETVLPVKIQTPMELLQHAVDHIILETVALLPTNGAEIQVEASVDDHSGRVQVNIIGRNFVM